ncbi:MAG: alpha/beta hydrolase-fold protein [Chloroflexota bacterium]
MIVTERLNSRHLAGNLLGDPSERDLVVYLPPSYGASNRRYPTVYLLHWYSARALDHTGPQWWEGYQVLPPIDELIDVAIAKNSVAEMIVVVPDGWTRYGCSQWVDSPVNGNFERYVLDDIVPYVDSHFRTIPASTSRGVFGLSSGGLGAWNLASQHPDLFGAMAVLSSDSYFDLTCKSWLYSFFRQSFPGGPNGPDKGGMARLCFTLASCYTPNVVNPPYFVDFPIGFPNGEVLQPLWERWLSYDPVVNWENRVDNLRALRGILLDVGANDEFNLQWGHRLLSRSLQSADIAHHAEEHSGNHIGRAHERYVYALGWLSETLDRTD